MLVFVKTGPFAWNGLHSWWIVAVDFFTWIVVMIVLTIRAAKSQPRMRAVQNPEPKPLAAGV